MGIFSRKFRVALIVCAVGAIVCGIIHVCQTGYFEAPEYKDASTVVIAEIELREDPSKKTQEAKQHLEKNQVVVMTGKLYGQRGEISHLFAEVLVHGSKGWVPLAALDACQDIPY